MSNVVPLKKTFDILQEGFVYDEKTFDILKRDLYMMKGGLCEVALFHKNF